MYQSLHLSRVLSEIIKESLPQSSNSYVRNNGKRLDEHSSQDRIEL